MPDAFGQTLRAAIELLLQPSSQREFSVTISLAPVRQLVFPMAFAASLLLLCAANAQTISAPIASAADTQSPILTLRTEARRVVVDIVVTDPKGKPVTGLTRKDFSVFEDNTPQTIHDFELHTITSQPDYTPPKLPKLPSNTFVNLAAAPATGTPTVLLYDLINTPLADQQYAHEEMVRFLKHRRPGVQVAIFVLGRKLQMLQGFTDDETQLEAVLRRKKGGPSVSLLIGGNSSGTAVTQVLTEGDPAATATSGVSTSPGSSQSLAASEIVDAFTHMGSLDASYLLDERVEITLDALTQIGRFVSGLPGRKNLVWLSASFPSNVLPDGDLSATPGDHGQSLRNFSSQIKQATDLLNLSHVAVYPIDVRGVIPNPAITPGQNIQFFQSLATERASMETIADSTGGHAFYSTNYIDEAIGDAMADGSTYYSLTYSPTNPNFDGSLRHIKVKLQQAGYTLAYRKTYFADDLHKAAEKAEDAPITPLGPSLEHGTPLSHELFVEAHLDAYGEPAAATTQQMEVLSRFDTLQSVHKKKSKGPLKPPPPIMMQRYVIEYGLVPKQLNLPVEADGLRRSSLEFGIISYDADGRKLNGIDSKIDETIPAIRFAHLQDTGYRVIQTVAVPVNAASLRLAVRDVLANRIGSLEVNLPLAKTPAAAIHPLDSGNHATPGPSSR